MPAARRLLALCFAFMLLCGLATAAALEPADDPQLDALDNDPGARPMGSLYPQTNAVRTARRLDGIWEFKADPERLGFREKWYAHPLTATRPMPVPASYNDETQDAALRDLVGWAWYETTTYAEFSADRRMVLRFGSVTHKAIVWVNGHEVARHKGGFLPFEAELDPATLGVETAAPGTPINAKLRITVAVDNRLDWHSLPVGIVKNTSDTLGRPIQVQDQGSFDFFNYAGIHRPVWLYTTPRAFVRDITVQTLFEGGQWVLHYDVQTAGAREATGDVVVHVFDDGNKMVADGINSNRIALPQGKAWSPEQPYLYTFRVRIIPRDEKNPLASKTVFDEYALSIGLRTIAVSGKQLLLNGKPIHLRGFGKHEDEDVRGKGLDEAMLVKDFNLLHWIGANSIRTSHYPYAEEFYQLADREGILVIDETPAVGLNHWKFQNTFAPDHVNGQTQAHHLAMLHDLILRDKNHPSVIAWSVANESSTREPASLPYYEPIVKAVREQDATRPVTIIEMSNYKECQVGQLFDFIGINRYYSWYTDTANLNVIEPQLIAEANGWWQKYHKPIYLSEVGADTIPGLHADPPVLFSEEFQVEMLRRFLATVDKIDFMVGEHVWNFADFQTRQELRRVNGNRKGVFTRERQPKMAAQFLRERWQNMEK